MEVTYGYISTAGPVRPRNEDSVEFWQSAAADKRRTHGTIALLADGIGGQTNGHLASRLAVDCALKAFHAAPEHCSPTQLLRRMFDAANIAVYDASMDSGNGNRMGTTLTISLFRNNEVFIGHVGDCRAYLVQRGRIRRVTVDHSYAGMQVKLGLLSAEDAINSDLRSVLTRSVGQDPIIRIDNHSLTVSRGDRVIQCCDGVYCALTEGEILDVASKLPPQEACQRLVEMAERRGAEDNLSVQIIQVESVERLSFYRGAQYYHKIQDMQAGMDLQTGQLLDDRFQIIDVISRSGMASIFKATDQVTGRTVALKVPFMQFESDPGFYQRFEREEEIGTKLSHPYILRMMPAPDSKSRPYIVMEYLEGQTLGHLMKSVRPLPVTDALRIASCLCEALQYMHEENVVHRDLKPENIMVCNDGSLRIMDFGIAKAEGMRRLTFGGFTPAMGTPDYMAPEQVKGKRGDARTDIYSLGAMLYEMVTGSAPFEGANPFAIMNARLTGDPRPPRKLNPEITPQVEEIILHAMSRNIADRYGSAREMKAELDHPETVQVTGRADRLVEPSPWKGHWQKTRLMILCVLIPLAIFGIIFLASHLRWK